VPLSVAAMPYRSRHQRGVHSVALFGLLNVAAVASYFHQGGGISVHSVVAAASGG
jgi:hypothetical protein